MARAKRIISSAVIRVADKNRRSTIQLFGYKHPHQLMRQSHRPKGNDLVSPLEQCRRKAIRTANGAKSSTTTLITPTPDQRSKCFAIDRVALFVKSNQTVFADFASNSGSFFSLAVVCPRCAALCNLKTVKTAEPKRAARLSGALEITISKEALRPILQAADSNQSHPHGSAGSGADALGRTVTTPHLFKIVELAHLRPEDMQNDVARIDEHPVAMRLALNTRCAEAL